MPEQRRTLFVEFLGAPGSGKSTIARLIADRLSASGRPVINPVYAISRRRLIGRLGGKTFFIAKALLTRSLAWRRASQFLAENGVKLFRDRCRLVLNALFIAGVYRHYRYRDGLCLIDQGVFQWLSSALVRARGGLDGGSAVESFRSRIASCRPDYLIVLEADDRELLSRLRNRSGGDSYVETQAEMSTALRDYVASIGSLVRSVSSIPHVVIRNHEKEHTLRTIGDAMAGAPFSIREE